MALDWSHFRLKMKGESEISVPGVLERLLKETFNGKKPLSWRWEQRPGQMDLLLFNET